MTHSLCGCLVARYTPIGAVLVLYTLAAVLYFVLYDVGSARYILKPIPLFLLALLALYQYANKRRYLLHCRDKFAAARPLLVAAALFLYGVGDLLLELRTLVSALLVVGVAMFACGHLIMIVVLWSTGDDMYRFHSPLLASCIPYIVLCWTSVFVLFIAVPVGVLVSLGTFVYGTILLTAAWRCTARVYISVRNKLTQDTTVRHLTYRSKVGWPEVFVLIGYHLFMLSDVVLIAHLYAGVPVLKAAVRVCVLVTYWISTALISTELYSESIDATVEYGMGN